LAFDPRLVGLGIPDQRARRRGRADRDRRARARVTGAEA
jgi:hypothetical protein